MSGVALLYGEDAAVAAWVSERLPHSASFGPCAAIGVVIGDDIAAGIVFHNWTPVYQHCELSMAAETPRWASRRVIKALLSYPFDQLAARRVETMTAHTNARALRFNKGLGFKQEGVLRHRIAPGVHGVVCGMLHTEYRRLFEGCRHGR